MDNRVMFRGRDVSSDPMFNPWVVLKRLQMKGKATVNIKNFRDVRGASRSEKICFMKAHEKTSKRKPKSDKRNIWLLPDGSFSFRKPKYADHANLHENSNSSLMMRSSNGGTRIRAVGENSKWARMPLWKQPVLASEKRSKRKSTVPIRFDAILDQIRDGAFPDDATLIQYLKEHHPSSLYEVSPDVGFTDYSFIVQRPKSTPQTHIQMKIAPIPKLRSSWKNPNTFFKGTIFETMFVNKDVGQIEHKSKEVDSTNTEPHWRSSDQLTESSNFEVIATRVRPNEEMYYYVARENCIFDMEIVPLIDEMAQVSHEVPELMLSNSDTSRVLSDENGNPSLP